MVGSRTRDDFPESVKQVVARRAGSICSNPDCRALTSGPQIDPNKALNVGVAAHIAAAAPGGPRYDAEQDGQHGRSAGNAIWLCQTCAKLIDNDPLAYPVDLLLDWKSRAERAALSQIGKTATASVLDGRELLELVKAHADTSDATFLIVEGLDALKKHHPDSLIKVVSEGKMLKLTIAPDNGTTGPVQVAITPSFPATLEGDQRKAAFDDFLMKGTPVELLSEDIPVGQLPPIIRDILPLGREFRVRLGPRSGSRVWPLELSAKSSDGSIYVFPWLEMRTAQAGEIEATLTNEGQNHPFHLSFVFRPTGAADFNWTFDTAASAYWHLESVRFQRVVASGATLALRDMTTGIEHGLATITRNDAPAPPSADYESFLERVVRVQQRTRIALFIPSRQITHDDVADLEYIEHIISTGQEPGERHEIEVKVVSEDVRLLRLIARSHGPLRVKVPTSKLSLLDNNLDLGPMVVSCDDIDIHAHDVKRLDGATFPLEIRLVGRNGARIAVEYPGWVTRGEPSSTDTLAESPVDGVME